MKFKKIISGFLALVLIASVSGVNSYAAVLPGPDVIVENVADLKDSVENAEMDKVIKLGDNFPLDLAAVNTFVIAHSFNITIDGQGKTLTTTGSFRHFDLKNTGSGTITLTNMTLLGKNTVDANDRAVKGTVGGGVVTREGRYLFDAMYFSKIRGSAVLSGSGLTDVTVNNSTFEYNTSDNSGGAICFEGGGNNLSVHNSAFYKNYTDALGYSGGAIVYKNTKAADIVNSVFIGNETRHLGGAIAFTNATAGAVVSIDRSYFENNQTVDPVTPAYRSWADAGAIGLYSPGAAVKFSLTSSTFVGNTSFDDGGALMIENPLSASGATTTITNNTFFKNTARGLGISAAPKADADGGAMQFSLQTYAVLEHNTIVMNKASGLNPELIIYGGSRGGGIAYHYDTSGLSRYPTVEMKNNLLYGNFVTDDTDTVVPSDYSNITISNMYDGSAGGTLIDNGGNIGIDDGSPLPANIISENILGVADSQVSLSQAYDASLIGVQDANNPYTLMGMPVLPILIKDGTLVNGLADGSAVVSGVTQDINNNLRSATAPDIGDVEVFWLKFDANGALYEGLPAFIYNGTYYYDTTQGTTPYYYQVSYNGASILAPDDTNIVHPDGRVFLGWSTTIDGAVEYVPGDTITLADNMTLYAQFEPLATYVLDFNLNGGTSILPDAQTLAEGDKATAPGVPTRDGFTFTGWNTQMDGSGITWDFGTMTMPANDVTLYAQWQENQNKIPPNDIYRLPKTGGNESGMLLLSGLLLMSGSALLLLNRKRQNK